MAEKQTVKTFHLSAIIGGHLISGTVSFSPAPEDGILTEIARLEAESLLGDLITSDIERGRI